MRSMRVLGLMAAVVATVAIGCGDDEGNNTTGGDGGSGGSGGSSTTTTTTTGSMTTTSTTVTSTSSGMTPPDGDDDFANASDFQLGTEEDAVLDPPATDVDFYKFDGQAGQQLLVAITAKPDDDPFSTAYVDTIVTLYDENQNQIAQNDDPFPRASNDSQLFTVLPADGTYYVRVAECNQVLPQGCADVDDITDKNYSVFIGGINPAILVNETPGSTTDFGPYVESQGDILPKIVSGGFSVDAETDEYSFTVPAVQVDPGVRALLGFSFFPSGTSQSGSTADIQRVEVVDSAGNIVAQTDPRLLNQFGELAEILAPLTAGETYTLRVIHETGAIGANPFYYTLNFPDVISDPLEAETVSGSNDTSATAESLEVAGQTAAGGVGYLIEGDLQAAGDVDYFSFEIPPDLTEFSASCSAQRDGSGLEGLTAEVRTAADATVNGATATEKPDAEADINNVDVPANEATLLLRISATAQSPEVIGSYYRCIVVVNPANAN